MDKHQGHHVLHTEHLLSKLAIDDDSVQTSATPYIQASSVPDTKSRHVPHTTQGSTTNEKEPRPGSKSE